MPSSDGQQFPPRPAHFECFEHCLLSSFDVESEIVVLLSGTQVVSFLMLVLSSSLSDGPYKWLNLQYKAKTKPV